MMTATKRSAGILACLLSLLFTPLLLCSCHDTDDDADTAGTSVWTVVPVSLAPSETVPTLAQQAAYGSMAVSIRGRGADTRAVVVACSSDWLKLAGDVAGQDDSCLLPADSIVAFTTSTNNSGSRRRAVISFTDADRPQLSATLIVEQLSQADQGSNATPRDILYIGYGYDIYKALENPMAVRVKHPILNYESLRQQGGLGLYQMVQDCHLSQTEVRYVASNSIHAFARKLAEMQTDDADNHFEGCSENCKTAQALIDPDNGQLNQHNFGHGSLEKAVAARVVDRAALIDLQRRGLMPFTGEFSERLRRIRYELSGEERTKAVEQTLVDFGTHVIIEVDLGGRIDYTFTMRKDVSFDNNEEMRQEIDYTLGRLADTDRTARNRNISSSKSQSGAITVTGGSEATRRQLESDIGGLSPSGQIDPSHLTNWLASINYSQYFERDAALEVIHFELMPVWDIVPDDLRQDFLEGAFRLVSRSDSSLPASFTGTDIYQMDANEAALFTFDNADDPATTLCRLLYIDDQPVLQVCQEYVPKIRTDRRVTIAYPIYKQKIRMNEGLFPGDGTHSPAYVGFSGGDCYVNPVDGYSPGDRIGTFYYVNGNLMTHNPANVDGLTGKSRHVENDCFVYVGDDVRRSPIVKVGSLFWTRRDISYEMGFTDDPESADATPKEYLIDGVLYTRFYYDLGYYAAKDNGWAWGWTPNTYFDGNPNQKWYLPTAAQVSALYKYLGFNPKALYRGQASGWNAEFNGYYGINDVVNGSSFADGQNALRYRGERNFTATRTNEEGNANAVVLSLDKNYNMQLYRAEGLWHDDYYPVRPVRGYMYTYPTLKELSENTE